MSTAIKALPMFGQAFLILPRRCGSRRGENCMTIECGARIGAVSSARMSGLQVMRGSTWTCLMGKVPLQELWECSAKSAITCLGRWRVSEETCEELPTMMTKKMAIRESAGDLLVCHSLPSKFHVFPGVAVCFRSTVVYCQKDAQVIRLQNEWSLAGL